MVLSEAIFSGILLRLRGHQMSDSHAQRGITFDLPSLTAWEATRREPPGQRGILYDVLQRNSGIIVNTPKSNYPQ
jgi:hypothetical protein